MISGPRSQQITVDQRSEALPGFKTLPVLDYFGRHRFGLKVMPLSGGAYWTSGGAGGNTGDLSLPYFGDYRSLAGNFGPIGGSSAYNRRINIQLRFTF